MTGKIDDGGPAFPQSEVLYEDGAELVRESYGGMTLRDWFASNAPKIPEEWYPSAFLGDSPKGTIFPYDGQSKSSQEMIEMEKDARRERLLWCAKVEATWRYQFADAMLAARSAK